MSAIAIVPDSDLLRDYQRGRDQGAFHTLVERYQAMVVGTAFRRTHNFELARDVAQEVFATLARKAGELLDRTSLGGWLHQAAMFQAARAVQAEVRRTARQERFSVEAELVAEAPPAASDRMEALDEALEFLASSDREVIVLHYFQDLSYAEMSELLRANEAAVRQRVSRALERLGKALRERGLAGAAVAVLAAAVAMQVANATPIGLAQAALAAAASGSAAALLGSLLSSYKLPLAALLAAAAGGSLWWELEHPRAATVPVAPSSQPAALVESGSPRPPSGEPVTYIVPEPAVLPVEPVTVSSEPAQHVVLSAPRVAAAPTAVLPRLAAPPAVPRALVAPVSQSARPIAPASRGSGSGGGSVLRDLTPNGLPVELPGPLGAVARSGGLPAVVAELQRVETLPDEAATLYTNLLQQLLSLDPVQSRSVEQLLLQHFAELNAKGLAGALPAATSTVTGTVGAVANDLQAARQEAIQTVAAGMQQVLGPTAGEPKVIQSVMSLVETPLVQSTTGVVTQAAGGVLALPASLPVVGKLLGK